MTFWTLHPTEMDAHPVNGQISSYSKNVKYSLCREQLFNSKKRERQLTQAKNDQNECSRDLLFSSALSTTTG